MQDDTKWTKPGPGTWELDTAHFAPECSQIIRDLMEAALPQGMQEGFALVGGPISGMDCRFVHGRFYRRLIPAVGANSDRPPPPAIVLWLASRLVPTLRRTDQTASKALSEKIWLTELERWEAEWKPALIARSRELGRVSPADLDDEALADHIEQLHDHLHHGTVLHFRLHASDLGPIGLLLVRGADMGLTAREMMDTLAGSSPATSAPSMAIGRLAQMVHEHDEIPTTVDELRALSPRVAEAFDEFIAEFGWRLTTGYDLRDTTLAETLELVVSAITNRQTSRGPVDEAARTAGAVARDQLLAKVAAADRDELASLIDDGRATYGLRDENGPITFQWPAGLLRRAILEAATRLERAGRLPETTQNAAGVNDAVFDLSADELMALLRGDTTRSRPSVAEIEARYRERHQRSEVSAPRFLGPEPPEPPLWALKPSSALLMRVVLEVVELLEVTPAAGDESVATGARSETDHGGTIVLTGVGIGSTPYEGVARVVTDDIDALSRVNPGDVVVAPFTVPTYNAVLAMAGAVITDNGGLLCHSAVIARELGIAAIVGAGQATARIPDGATVVVDPGAGTVTVITPP